jgi:putative peptidoglycan lipid II flippase
MKKVNILTKSSIHVTLLSLLGLVFSFVLQMIIAYYFGTEFERDAYFIAIAIPSYISSIFIGSFGVIFLPKITQIISEDNKELVSEFISTTFCLLAILLLIIIALCTSFSVEIISFFAPNFNSSEIEFTSHLLTIVIPSIFFVVLTCLLGALYQIDHKFIRPALLPIFSSVIGVVFVTALNDKIGVLSLAYGFLTGSILSMILVWPITLKYNLKFLININNINVSYFFKTAMPLFLSGILFRSTVVIERMIASNLTEGSVSYLGYANQIFMAFLAITVSGIAVTSFPVMSKLWNDGNEKEIEDFLSQNIQIILIISIPILISVVFFGDIFVKIIFERGAFDSVSTISVSKALLWSMGAFLCQGLGSVIMKVFYLSGKTITVSVISIFELCLFFILSLILSKRFGYIGLAMALSISSFIAISLAVIIINKVLIKISFHKIFVESLKILFASILGVLTAYLLYDFIEFDSILCLILCYAIGLTVYFKIGKLVGINEFNILINNFLRLKNKLTLKKKQQI